MPAKHIVDMTHLSPAEQDELAGVIRHLRALITNLRVYPEGHRVVGEVAQRATEHLGAAAAAHGQLLLDAQETTLRCNAEVIYNDVPERDEAPKVAAWLRERGLTNMLVAPEVQVEELLKLFGWLSATQPKDARESFVGGIPDVLETENLQLNVRVRGAYTEELEVYLEEALDSVDLEGAVRHALEDKSVTMGVGLESGDLREQLISMVREEMADATQTGIEGGAVDAENIDWSRIDLSQVLDPETLEDLVADFMENEFDADAVFGGSEDLEERLEEIVSSLKDTLNTEDLGPLQDTLLQRAASMVAGMVPEAVGDFLGNPAVMGTLEQRVQDQVMAALADQEKHRAQVLENLVGKIQPGGGGEQFHASVAAMEELLPDMLSSVHRAEAVAGLAAIAEAAHSDDLELDCRLRAESALRLLAGPDLIPVLTNQLRTAATAQSAQARRLLIQLGHEAVIPLLEILRSSLDQTVRLAIVGVLVELGQQEKAEGAKAPRSLIPLLREVRHYEHNPWYFTRNLVEVLVKVGSPTFEQELLVVLDSDLDYRVLAAVAQGLADAQSEEIQAALRGVLFKGRVIVPEAFEELLLRVVDEDPEGTLAELEQMLTAGVAPDRIERVSLSAIARHMGATAVPLLGKLLTTRSRILRRPQFGEEHRLMAVEALGMVDDDSARALLKKARKDPSEEVRRRAALRLEQGPSGSAPGSSSQEVPWA